jgi:hypothetical protein
MIKQRKFEREMEKRAQKHEHRPQPKDLAQVFRDYCARDHAPKTEFNPKRTFSGWAEVRRQQGKEEDQRF